MHVGGNVYGVSDIQNVCYTIYVAIYHITVQSIELYYLLMLKNFVLIYGFPIWFPTACNKRQMLCCMIVSFNETLHNLH